MSFAMFGEWQSDVSRPGVCGPMVGCLSARVRVPADSHSFLNVFSRPQKSHFYAVKLLTVMDIQTTILDRKWKVGVINHDFSKAFDSQ